VGPEETSLTESLLRRDRWVVVAGLAAITLLSWLYIMAGAGTGMSPLHMTSLSLFPHRMAEMEMGGMPMHPGAWAPGYWAIVLLMWWVMMIAMMTPSAAPMILLYARATRHAQAGGQPQQAVVPTAAFAGGYLLAWLAFSLIATALMWSFERFGTISAATMASTVAWLSAAILFAAGLYQLSPLKHACLSLCRSPAAFLSRHWRPGTSGALRMGVQHGVFCVGCCWVLMALLFVGGVMNILWIAVLSLFVLIEKVAPVGIWFSRTAAAILMAWGLATLFV
jgi:predicted metal-binding membrane protein